MRIGAIFICLFLLACGPEPKKTAVVNQKDSIVKTTAPATSVAIENSAENTREDNTPADEPLLVPPVKKPSGVYRFLLPSDKDEKILHTIAFYPTTYRLQEEYGKEDSTVITEGTWAPSEGTIWLYKGQIVRGRYSWKDDTLQYISPRWKKSFSLEKLLPATSNQVWQTKRQEGVVLYGVGNEPFWSVEVTKYDSIALNMPDWNTPLRVKLSATNAAKDSIVYTAEKDSLQVTVYPLFCNDGMSDFLYTKRVKVAYRGQTFRGCGEVLRQAH